MIEIKYGQWWRTRAGVIVFVFSLLPKEVTTNVLQPVAVVSKDGAYFSHCTNGKYLLDASQSGRDLVEHLPDCMGFDWKPQSEYVKWTFETMPVAVKVRRKGSGDLCLAQPLDRGVAKVGGWVYSYADLFREFEQLDGSPCGLLASQP